MTQLTRVEQYVIGKGWDYRGAGINNIAVEHCPFCQKGGYKFFINVDNFLWDCKRPDCSSNAGSKPGGNEWKLKTHMGDKMSEVVETATAQHARGEKKVEGIPNYEQAHEWLLENSDLMNYLIDSRGWTPEIVKRMKIGMMNRYIADAGKEQGCFTYPYINGGECEFVKFRTLPQYPKNFASLAGRSVPLYNQDAVKKASDYLILVEGEADCVSVLALGEENVVGVPGAGMKQVDWADLLLGFPGKLILLFDNDSDGQTGAKKFAERFGIDMFYNIVLPEFDMLDPVEDKHGVRTKGKDITEWIQAGHTLEDFKGLLRSAQLFAMDGATTIRQSLANLRQEIMRRGTNDPQYVTPWPSLNKAVGGFEDGQLVIVQAAQKTGKTSLCLNWADHLVRLNKINVLFECLEMPDTALVRKWASYITNTDDSPSKLNYNELLYMLDEADGVAEKRENEIIFGYTGVTSLEAEFERLRSMIRRHGTKVLFFDNLQFLVDKLWAGERQGGRPAFMSKVTKMFKSLAMDMKVLVVLIAQTKSLDEDAVATSKSLEGSSAPGNDCDCMMIMNRTKSMPVKSKDQLKSMAQLGENNLSTATLDPELYIDVGLTRYAPGGLVVLMIDGSRSLVKERDMAEVLAARMENGQITQINGTKILRSEEPTPRWATNDVDADTPEEEKVEP